MADIHQKLQEEKLLRATRARRRFKAAIRNVIHNMYWLDDDEDEFDPMDPRKTYLLLRKKRPKDGLSIKEKVLLRKHKEYRTKEEIKYLHKFIGGLACFRQYPEDVQLGLVGVTYFEYFGPGRIIVRENDEGHALYFLLSGEVEISKHQWDEITNEFVEEKVTTIHPGKMFGEIALLHDVPRTATVTTTAPCELLVLKKDDFDCVLKASLMEQWETIKDALSKFVYFKNWNNVIIRECCLLSKMHSFSTNEIVYGDRILPKGAVKMTYFIVEGTCKLVEHMYIQEKNIKGRKYYSLYNMPKDDEEEVQKVSFSMTESEKRLLNDLSVELESEIEMETEEELETEIEPETEIDLATELEPETEKEPTSEIDTEPATESEKEPATDTENELKSGTEYTTVSDKKESVAKTSKKSEKSVKLSDHQKNLENGGKRRKSSIRKSRDSQEKYGTEAQDFIRRETNKLLDSIHVKKESDMDKDLKLNSIDRIEDLLSEDRRQIEHRARTRCSDVPKDVKLVFMQICTLSETATFFENELMKNRRLIAMSPVKVLVIPTYWLVQHNKGNVWNRIERYLQYRIPSREQVFEQYKQNKKWEDYKKKLRDDILSKKKFYNNTTIHDVPYSIRIMSNYNL